MPVFLTPGGRQRAGAVAETRGGGGLGSHRSRRAAFFLTVFFFLAGAFFLRELSWARPSALLYRTRKPELLLSWPGLLLGIPS